MYTFIQTGRFFFLLSSKIIAITARFRTNNWGFVNKPGSAPLCVKGLFRTFSFQRAFHLGWLMFFFQLCILLSWKWSCWAKGSWVLFFKAQHETSFFIFVFSVVSQWCLWVIKDSSQRCVALQKLATRPPDRSFLLETLQAEATATTGDPM